MLNRNETVHLMVTPNGHPEQIPVNPLAVVLIREHPSGTEVLLVNTAGPQSALYVEGTVAEVQARHADALIALYRDSPLHVHYGGPWRQTVEAVQNVLAPVVEGLDTEEGDVLEARVKSLPGVLHRLLETVNAAAQSGGTGGPHTPGKQWTRNRKAVQEIFRQANEESRNE